MTLTGQDIICLAIRRWDSTWKNNQKVMSLLAQANRVVYVGPPRPFRGAVRAALGRASGRSNAGWAAGRPIVYEEPWYMTRINPFRRGSHAVNWMIDRFRLAHVRRLCRGLGLTAPILWVYDPMLAYAVGSFGEELVVYHVIDNYDEHFPAHATRLRSLMAQNQQFMLKRADVVFAVSEGLLHRCLEVNPNSYLVPNGVNYDLFEDPRSDEVPADVIAIPRPIVGYVGTIRPQVDFSLVGELAVRRPGWSFMMVGPEEFQGKADQFNALRQRRNVYYLGPKPVDVAPRYMMACDVVILPYKIDGYGLYGDSQKLYEYLASGRPVVSSDMPSARRFAPLVTLARNPSEFLDGIEMGLAEDGARSGERKAVARQHSWDRRVETMGELVSSMLGRAAGAHHRSSLRA